jgi:hypothetical protein
MKERRVKPASRPIVTSFREPGPGRPLSGRRINTSSGMSELLAQQNACDHQQKDVRDYPLPPSISIVRIFVDVTGLLPARDIHLT